MINANARNLISIKLNTSADAIYQQLEATTNKIWLCVFFFLNSFWNSIAATCHSWRPDCIFNISFCYWNIHKVEAFYHYNEFCQGIDFMSYFINDAYCIYLSIDASGICLLKIQSLNVASHSILNKKKTFWKFQYSHNVTFKFIKLAVFWVKWKMQLVSEIAIIELLVNVFGVNGFSNSNNEKKKNTKSHS